MKYSAILIITFILVGCVGVSSPVEDKTQTKNISVAYQNELEQKYGISKISHPANGSVTLDSKKEWCGITIWVVIPIPLQLPVCESSLVVNYENGIAKSVTQKWPDSITNACGPGVWLMSGTSENSGGAKFCASIPQS